MSTIKSFSVGNGDMFYINHNGDNFTIIDCCLNDDTEDGILNEITKLKSQKGITRFISTHPDEDHIRGLTKLDDQIEILNFYCVKNNVTKSDESNDFKHYRDLLINSHKAFYISKGCTRRWMNLGDDARDSSGINILWPDCENKYFKEALKNAAEGESPNNISPVIQYSLKGGVTALWMGDLEKDFMESIKDDIDLQKVDILFAPHHGRESGKIPSSMLEKLNPRIVVIGEAPSKHLNYYSNYNTITQNSAGDIAFSCEKGKVHIFTSKYYDIDFLEEHDVDFLPELFYMGTLIL